MKSKYISSQLGIATWTLLLIVAAAIVASVAATYFWTKQQTPSQELLIANTNSKAVQVASVAGSPPASAEPAQSPSAKMTEIVLSKDEKVTLANHGGDGAKALSWRDFVDEKICAQLNPFEVKQLAGQLSSKDLVLRVETTSALLALLERCQPGATKFIAPATVYLSQGDKAAILKDGFSAGTKALAQQAGGLDIPTCTLLSNRDIDHLLDFIKIGRLELTERTKQQLPDLLQLCRK